jgi:hypothetical protein
VDGTGYSAKYWAAQAAGSAAAVTTNTIIPAETFTGNGVATDFTISRGVSYPGALLVTVAGVQQAPVDAYTTPTSTTLRFSSAPGNGVLISVRYLDKEAQSGAAAAQEWATKTTGPVSGSTEYSAKYHAGAAAASSAVATQKAADASGSATSAAASAATSTTKASEASGSASAAASLATTATTKAGEASASATSAGASASASATSATASASSAATATTKASDAATSAATATTKAAEASGSATGAASSASAANTSASQASTSATSAATSATASATSASNAQTYATQAQAAAASAQGSSVASQVFTGNGSATDFALSTAAASVTKLMVTVANVIQDSLDAYVLVNSGATLRFTSAPLNGVRIVVRYL